MSVYFCVPSARPNGGTAAAWKEKGYRLALWRDRDDEVPALGPEDIRITAPYPGYSQSVNALMKAAFEADPDCQWCVTGGDDTLPDPDRSPERIAFECGRHFGLLQNRFRAEPITWSGPDGHGSAGTAPQPWSSYGVMQPTGDDWAGYCIERICGSPWVGRTFWDRTYSGNGPMWHEYWHNYNDDELQDVSKQLGVLWQRRDVTHFHEHWMRAGSSVNRSGQRPGFLDRACSPELVGAMKSIYEQRRAAGFPGAFVGRGN